jgi:hypothetical protein
MSVENLHALETITGELRDEINRIANALIDQESERYTARRPKFRKLIKAAIEAAGART